MIARALVLIACAAVSSSGCFVREGEAASPSDPDSGQPLQFTFGTLDGQEVSSDTTRGRTTALLFVTTYDLPSQAEAQLLRDVLATHRPRANGAVVIMEPPRAAELAQVWARSIDLRLPIAMASPTLLSGDSELGRIQGVPTLIVLDRDGRLLERREGALTREELIDVMARARPR